MPQKPSYIEPTSNVDVESSSNFRALDWDKLKYFYYVAKMGNISHAAQLLNTNQSSFSRQVSALENQIGYPLFSRNRNGVTLTHKGRELYQVVERIFFTIKGFTSRMDKPFHTGQRRKIRIATNHELASYVISSLILEYNKDRPHFIFEVLEINGPIDVVFHNIDIAIQPQVPKENDELWQVIQEPFISLNMGLYASASYLEKKGTPKSIGDLANHSLIISSTFDGYYVKETRGILEILEQIDSKRPKLVFMSNSLECLIEAAQQDKGIVCLSNQLAVVKESNLERILPLLSIQDCQQYIISPKYLKDDKEISGIKMYLRDQLMT